MKLKELSVLIVGDEPTLGCPVVDNQAGYIPRLLAQLQRSGWRVQLEYHATEAIGNSAALLCAVNLERFDLIVLTLGHSQLHHTAGTVDSFYQLLQKRPVRQGRLSMEAKEYAAAGMQKAGWLKRLIGSGELVALQLLASIGQVGRLRATEAEINDLLGYLRPYRQRLVLLTPFPHPQLVSNWLRQKGRHYVVHYGRQHRIPVFDTATIVGRGAEYFADTSSGCLSTVASDLLGQTLFEYIGINGLLPIHPEMRQRRG